MNKKMLINFGNLRDAIKDKTLTDVRADNDGIRFCFNEGEVELIIFDPTELRVGIRKVSYREFNMGEDITSGLPPSKDP